MRRIEDDRRARRRASSTRVAIAGQSLLLDANASNFGAMFVMLDDFHERTRAGLSGDAIAAELQRRVPGGDPRTALVNVFGAPPVDGLGTAGGFKLMSRTAATAGSDALQNVGRADRRARAKPTRELHGLFTSFRANTPWLYLDIDRTKAKTMGVSLERRLRHPPGLPGLALRQRLQPLRPHLAGQRPGRRRYRMQIEDIKQLKVRNAAGEMVPLGTLASVRDDQRPGDDHPLQHVSRRPPINGEPAPGVSSGAGDRD